jgi:S-adenosyl methyltransferase
MSSRCRTARRSSSRAWWGSSAKREELPARGGTDPTCCGSLPAAPTERWWEARGGQALPPNAARVSDYLLGGTQHLPADRAFASALEERAPDVRGVCRAIRAFLGRAAVFSMQRGIHQFLVLGEGLVADGDVHEAARVLDPTVRIAVVDSDPVTTAVNHTRLLLVPGAVAARADLSRPARVLQLPDVQAVLDLSRPVAVLLGGALAALSDLDDPCGVVARYAAGLSAGSYLVAWHASGDNWSHAERAASMWAEHVGPAPLWSRGQMQDCLSGLDLAAPGIVDATEWHPRRATPARGERPGAYAAVARL